MRYGYGLDIYGTHTKIGFFDETGELVEKWKMVTPMLYGGFKLVLDQQNQA